MAAIDLSSVLSQVATIPGLVNNINTQAQGAQSQIAADTTGMAAASTAAQKADATVGTANAIIESTKDAATARAQQNAAQYASYLGNNLSDNSDLMQTLSKSYLDESSAAMQARQQIGQKESVAWYNDPVQWLQNQFTLPYDYNTYNTHADLANDAEQKMSSIFQMTSAEAQSQANIAETSTAATVQAQTDKAKAVADAAAQQVAMDGYRYNIAGVQAGFGLSEDQLNNYMAGIKTNIEAKGLQVQEAYRDLQGQMYSLEAKKVNMMYDEKLKQDSADADIAMMINKGRRAAGFTNDLPAARIQNLLKMGGPEGEALKQFYVAGTATDSMKGNPVLGGTPAQVAQLLLMSGAPGTAPTKPISDFITEQYANAHTESVNAGQKDPVVIASKANKAIDQQVDNWAGNIKAGDYNNIYQAPTLPALVQAQPKLTSLPLWQQVIAPQVQAGNTSINADQLLGSAVAAVRAGTLDAKTAASNLSTIFAGVVATNNAVKNYTRFGIKYQSDFNTKVDTGTVTSLFGGKQTVDMTNPTQVTNALVKRLSNEAQTAENAKAGGMGMVNLMQP